MRQALPVVEANIFMYKVVAEQMCNMNMKETQILITKHLDCIYI